MASLELRKKNKQRSRGARNQEFGLSSLEQGEVCTNIQSNVRGARNQEFGLSSLERGEVLQTYSRMSAGPGTKNSGSVAYMIDSRAKRSPRTRRREKEERTEADRLRY